MKYPPRHFLIALLLISTGLILLLRPVGKPAIQITSPSPSLVPVHRQVILTIDFGDTKFYSYTQNVPATTSALSLLETVTARQNISLVYEKYPFGTLVQSIGDLKNSSQKAWIYFVNGKSPEIGADKYILAPGDQVEWKYILPEM